MSQLKSLMTEMVKELKVIKENVDQNSKDIQAFQVYNAELADGFVSFTASNTETAVINAGGHHCI